MSQPTAARPSPAALPPEVVARLEVALRASPAEDLPLTTARSLYDLLVRHGFDRADVLSLAASLVDQVATEASLSRAART